MDDMQLAKDDEARFRAAVDCARREWGSRRRRLAPFLQEDYTTIGEKLLEASFWPFSHLPACEMADRVANFPCKTNFEHADRLYVPRSAKCRWDFIHQLAHWCLPREGHNQNFCAFYAALVEHAFGKLAARSLRRAYEDFELLESGDWFGPPIVRHKFLHPFTDATLPSGENRHSGERASFPLSNSA
jgi:hypothetical protein